MPKKPVIFEQIGEDFDDVMSALLDDQRDEPAKDEETETEEPEKKRLLQLKFKVDKQRASKVLDRLKGKSKKQKKTKSDS